MVTGSDEESTILTLTVMKASHINFRMSVDRPGIVPASVVIAILVIYGLLFMLKSEMRW